MSVRIRLGPFSVSSRGRVGVRVGPVSVSGGGHRRKRSSASNTRRSPQVSQRTSMPPNRQRDPMDLEAWLKAPPPRLKLPERFTQNWFAEHAAEIHPGQLVALIEELISRGWSREDIERRAVPQLKRAASERRVIIERHKHALQYAAIKRQIVEDHKAANEQAAAKRRAARSARWHAVFSTPARMWRRHRQSEIVEVGSPSKPDALVNSERKAFCPSCGDKAIPDDRFCNACGNALSAE